MRGPQPSSPLSFHSFLTNPLFGLALPCLLTDKGLLVLSRRVLCVCWQNRYPRFQRAALKKLHTGTCLPHELNDHLIQVSFWGPMSCTRSEAPPSGKCSHEMSNSDWACHGLYSGCTWMDCRHYMYISLFRLHGCDFCLTLTHLGSNYAGLKSEGGLLSLLSNGEHLRGRWLIKSSG